jgi:hypothetical protein
MEKILSNYIRYVVSKLPAGEVKFKKRDIPKEKPPRVDSDISNVSSKPEYFSSYMKERRENGKDYQKVPKIMKEFRKKQRKKKKEKEKSE